MSFILGVPFCIPLVLFERADAFLVSVNYIINRFYLKKRIRNISEKRG